MTEELWEKRHKEWIKNVFMQSSGDEGASTLPDKPWIQPNNEMVGSYYAEMSSLEKAEVIAVDGNPDLRVATMEPTPLGRFTCQQCGMSFATKSAHTSHARSHGKPPGEVNGGGTGAEPYKCDVCSKTFTVPARLVRHYRTHTGERPYECEYCHKMFSVKENLQVHRRIHTKERPYRCSECDRAFEHSGKLHRHMRIHTGERPHRCKVCDKTFIQSGQLVIHLRTHTGEKPYRCSAEGCGKGFTCSKQLKVHSRTHTGEKPYHCDICFRDFGYNHVLKLHRVQHYGAKCYKCTICDDTFKSKKEMETHIKGHADDMPDPPIKDDAPVPSMPEDLQPTPSYSIDPEYFRPAQIPQLQPILESENNVVKCVEAALAAVEGTSPLSLTPPASTPERSPSPEGAPRDMQTLPLRKRKMYLIETVPIRINSVIQFARSTSSPEYAQNWPKLKFQ